MMFFFFNIVGEMLDGVEVDLKIFFNIGLLLLDICCDGFDNGVEWI